MDDNYLAHHGVKGQKWGVRRYQNEDGTLTAEGKRRQRGQTLLGKLFSKKGTKKETIDDRIKKMSDQELQAAINRLNNEKRYKELTTPQKSQFLKNLIEGFSKGTGKAASDVVASLTKELGKKILNQAFGDDKNEQKKEELTIGDLLKMDDEELTTKQYEAKMKYLNGGRIG